MNLMKAYFTPVQEIGGYKNNRMFVKREDMIPYSFGGNKARKARLFFDEFDKGNYNCVVTYGSSHSNHCRIVSNMAAERKVPCYIIAPEEVSEPTYNSCLMSLFGAEFTVVPVELVSKTIEDKLSALKEKGEKPYFIPGGGHGNTGTQAYVDCYNEIKAFEQENGIHFDYIFFASGTGTTHSGLVCGQLLCKDERTIIGISIARKNPRGRDVVIESVSEYMQMRNVAIPAEEIEAKTIFKDDYTGEGYGKNSGEIKETIYDVMIKYGIPLDATYTGKAFLGMCKEIEKQGMSGKNILFIHTGGTPLFFDELKEFI